jgi:hypothetical protein
MKVFEVLHEALDIQQLPSGEWAVVDTDTGRPVSQLGRFDSAGSAEEARDSLRARTASSPDTAPRDGSSGRREPRITNTPITDPPPDGRREPRFTNPDMDMRTDIKPGTPSTGGLSAAEQRRISRTGSITRNGTVYTRADIARRDAAIRAAGGDPTKPPLQQQAASQSRNPTGKQGFLRILIGKIWDHPLFKGLRSLMGSSTWVALTTALNISQVEDALDGYLRAIKQEAEGIGPDGQARFINSIRSGNTPTGVARAYTECVERVTQLLLEAIIALVLGGTWTVAILAGLSLGTGFIGAILALIAGGAFVIGGTALMYEILDRVGVIDMLENLVSRAMTPAQMLGWAITIDGYQEYFGVIADEWGRLLSVGTVDNAGDLIRDSIVYEESKGIVSSEEQKNIIKDIIKSDPKLLSAYNDGKEEAKEIMRSQNS